MRLRAIRQKFISEERTFSIFKAEKQDKSGNSNTDIVILFAPVCSFTAPNLPAFIWHPYKLKIFFSPEDGSNTFFSNVGNFLPSQKIVFSLKFCSASNTARPISFVTLTQPEILSSL
jgi:hypothetical protein